MTICDLTAIASYTLIHAFAPLHPRRPPTRPAHDDTRVLATTSQRQAALA